MMKRERTYQYAARQACFYRLRRKAKRDGGGDSGGSKSNGDSTVNTSDDTFVRTPFQEKIKQADDFVKDTQKNIGSSINKIMIDSGIGKAIGVRGDSTTTASTTTAATTGTSSRSVEGVDQMTKKWPEMREELMNSSVKSLSKEEVRQYLIIIITIAIIKRINTLVDLFKSLSE